MRPGLLLLCLLPAAVAAQRPPCPEPDTTMAWVRVNKRWSDERGHTWTDDALRRALLSLAERDQADRATFGLHATEPAYVARLQHADSILADTLALVLKRHGLPTRSMVGAKGSDAAMLIVQHNWRLQEDVLARITRLPPGEISPQALAMLEDRVLVHQGKRQRYGTQFNLGKDGKFRFAPTSDLATLAGRREAAGLPPMAYYVCGLEEQHLNVDRTSVPGLKENP